MTTPPTPFRPTIALVAALAALLLGLALSDVASAQQIIAVGPDRPIRTIAEAARRAGDGDIVEIDAGDYRGDVAVWTQRRVTIRGLGTGARLHADGQAAEGKAIWVIRDGDVRVENVGFYGARVSSRNGAGIRFERGRLVVEYCDFEGNENGILSGNSPDMILEIRNSRFSRNGHGDGYSHNLYAGTIRSLTVTGSYFRAARVGHLLKSRAAENYIAYNRLTDESDGSASYELEFPNGGIAVVFGNVIQQGARTENPTIVSYAAEGYRYPRNQLDIAYNTVINDRPGGGNFLFVAPGTTAVRAFNNLLVGPGAPGIALVDGNVRATPADLAAPERHDYRLRASSRLVGSAVTAPPDRAPPPPPAEYLHPMATVPLEARSALHPGAFQTLAE